MTTQTTPQPAVRRLEFGEMTNPETDFGVKDSRVIRVQSIYEFTKHYIHPHYRITLAQPVPEQPAPADYEYEALPLVPTHTVNARVTKLDKMPAMNCDDEPAPAQEPVKGVRVEEGEILRPYIEAGPGWRRLGQNEKRRIGDQFKDLEAPENDWITLAYIPGELLEDVQCKGFAYRRPIDSKPADAAPDVVVPQAVDIVRHEVEELRKANDQLLERCIDLENRNKQHIEQVANARKCASILIDERDQLKRERDSKAEALTSAVQEANDSLKEISKLKAELAALKSQPEAKAERWITPTDEDAKRRPECEVRMNKHDEWRIGGKLIAVTDDAYHPFKTLEDGGGTNGWKLCRIRVPDSSEVGE